MSEDWDASRTYFSGCRVAPREWPELDHGISRPFSQAQLVHGTLTTRSKQLLTLDTVLSFRSPPSPLSPNERHIPPHHVSHLGGGSVMYAPDPVVTFSGDGLVNSADTGVVGDTNGDGVVDGLDTGLVG